MENCGLCNSVILNFRTDASEKLKHICSVLQMEENNYLFTLIFFIAEFVRVFLKMSICTLYVVF